LGKKQETERDLKCSATLQGKFVFFRKISNGRQLVINLSGCHTAKDRT